MVLSAVLILFAVLFAAMLAYGTDPQWAQYGRPGIDFILLSRRLEWPIIFTAVICCLGLLALVISSKQRAWWLTGLVPVMALFFHRVTQPADQGLRCVQDLPLVLTSQIILSDDDWVVGCTLDGGAVAIPYATLSSDAVIVFSGHEKQIVFFWSAGANDMQAYSCSRDLRAADLEVVCTINNAPAIFNSRLGQFINGLTGKTFKGELPTGLHQPIETRKCTWRTWRKTNPDTRIMVDTAVSPGQSRIQQPDKIFEPGFEDSRSVCVVATTQPLAVPSQSITDRPLNLTSGQSAILLVRTGGSVRAFSRELPGELVPRFFSLSDPKHPDAVWGDSDTNSLWSVEGQWVTGPIDMHHTALKPIPIQDDLYWNVMKYWQPDLQLANDDQIKAGYTAPIKPTAERPSHRDRRSGNR